MLTLGLIISLTVTSLILVELSNNISAKEAGSREINLKVLKAESLEENWGLFENTGYSNWKRWENHGKIVDSIEEDIQNEKVLTSHKVDENYEGNTITLHDSERYLIQRVVMGETSGMDFEAAAIVAQAIRDSMITDNKCASTVIRDFKYTSNLKEPNQNVIDAVNYIFDEGKYIVKHRVMYFYAPQVTRSNWHETQNFVVEYGGHRVFDRK